MPAGLVKFPNATAQIADRITTMTVNLMRVSAGMRNTILRQLESLEAELVRDILTAGGKSALSLARLSALLKQTRDTINTAYAEIATETPASLAQIATSIAKRTLGAVNAAVKTELMTVALSPEQVAYIAGKTVVNGRFPAQWWGKQSARLRDKFAEQMRLGQYRGESVDELIRRVRGTKAMDFRDGVMQASKRQAEALVRTSVIAVANEAKLASYLNNRDVIKGIQWVATLDDRTCWSPETLVNMADGTRRPIGKIKRGDYIQGGITGRKCKVLGTFLSFENEVIAVYLDNGKRAGFTTKEHRWLTPDGWEHVGDSLSSDISEREVLCRSIAKRRQATARAFKKGSRNRKSRALQRDQKTRQTESNDAGDMRQLPGSIRGRKAIHRDHENIVPERIQHDGGRRGRRGPSRRIQEAGNRTQKGALSNRQRIPSEDNRDREKIRTESVRCKPEILCDSAGQSFDETTVQISVEKTYNRGKPEAKKPTHAAHDEQKNGSELERRELPKKGERSARTRAGGAKMRQPAMGSPETKENCGCDAEEMARPHLSSEDGSKITTGTITCRERKRRTAILSLTIEGDRSYVAGGIVVHNTEICRFLNGKVWLLPEVGDKDSDYVPDGHTTPFPGATAHWQCRSVQVPVTFSFAELAAREEE